MTTRQSRRKLIVVVLLFLAVAGATIRHFAARGTTTRDIGTLMLLLWIPVIGNVVAWLLARLKRPAKPAPATAGAMAAAAAAESVAKALETPFRAHALADITLRPAPIPADDLLIAEGEHVCAFVVGTEGFSGRWRVGDGGAFRRGTTQRLPVEFLSPTVALTRLVPGTAFRMLVGEAFIGDGMIVGPASTMDR
jgi:hypothetical protein